MTTPSPEPPSALTGIRVLDFTRYQQGPFATVLLSDMGAEVVKPLTVTVEQTTKVTIG